MNALQSVDNKINSTTEKSDQELVFMAQRSPQEFKFLYERYYKRIFLFVHRRINEKQITADITSQVFLKALINIASYKHLGLPFSAWLYRIALNECNEFFRKNSRHRFVSIEDNTIHDLHHELTSDTAVEDLHERLPSILEKLAEDELHLLELRYFEQRPFREVAQILGISEVYAKTKVYRLLEKMKSLFMQNKS